MSQRMTMDEVLKEYGVPLIKLDLHATRSELLKLREQLIAIRDVSNATEQGYLDIDCKLYIDVDDIDQYLAGTRDTVGEIYAFPEDITSYKEQQGDTYETKEIPRGRPRGHGFRPRPGDGHRQPDRPESRPPWPADRLCGKRRRPHRAVRTESCALGAKGHEP